MTITGDLDLLTKHQTTESNHVLSIYLNVKPQETGIFKRHSEVELLTRFRSIQEQLSNETERRSFRASARRVRQFMARHRPAGLGMVLFCGDQDGFFWWRDLKVPVRTEVHWTHSPHIRPLLELQDEFERYCVILTDREQGQLFTVFMGEIEQHLEVASSTEIKRSKKPGSDHIRSQMQFQRKADLHALWHLKKVAKLAARQMCLRPYDRLILAGPPETTAVLHRLLPKLLKTRVVGSISLPVHSTPEAILAATLNIEQRVERETEVKLVDDLVVTASKSMRAVTGLAATLLALNNKELWKLVYAKESSTPGMHCTVCDRLYETDRFWCGHCGKPLQPVDDLIELMAERLIRMGRRIEQVRGEAAQHLKEFAGIGAFLRLRGRRPSEPVTPPRQGSTQRSSSCRVAAPRSMKIASPFGQGGTSGGF